MVDEIVLKEEEIYSILSESSDEYLQALDDILYFDEGMVVPEDNYIGILVDDDKPSTQTLDSDKRLEGFRILIYKKGIDYLDTRRTLKALKEAVTRELKANYGSDVSVGVIKPIGDSYLMGLDMEVIFQERIENSECLNDSDWDEGTFDSVKTILE